MLAGDLADLELGGVGDEATQDGGGDDVVGVDEALLGLVFGGLGRDYLLADLRAAPDPEVGDEVGDKAGGDDSPVLIHDRRVCYDVGDVAVVGAEKCQRGREDEEGDVVVAEEPDDGGQDRERRVVYYYAVFGILCQVLVVAPGKERPDDLAPREVGDGTGELEDRVVDGRRGVAVVGGELLLEFVGELVVALVAFASFGGEAAFPHLALGLVLLGPGRDAPVRQGEVVPVVGELVPVPGAEGSVVLHGAALDGQVVLVRVRIVHDARKFGAPFLLRCGQAKVTGEHDVLLPVRHDQQRAVLQEVLILAD